MPSVACRLGKLIGMVNAGGEMHGLRAKLLVPLQRAESRMHRADALAAAGKTAKAHAFLRRATHDLRVFRARLGSRRARRFIPSTARDLMLGLAEPLTVDLKTLGR